MENYTVPGFYAKIEDYQLSALETPQSLKEDSIIFFGDLPDFVYVADEQSDDVNAVKRVRITPNTVLPVTNVSELISTLTGENILDGILTQEQKDELSCKDMINVIKMSESVALAGKLAIVKIVKRDGHRPDINNKFEVQQALENAYEKLGSIKCSQIVPIGIAGDEDFITGEEKDAEMIIEQAEGYGAVVQDKIFKNVYNFNPVQSVDKARLEFALMNTEMLNPEGTTPEAEIIKTNGLDSPEAAKLFKGKVLVNGAVAVQDVELKFVDDKFLTVKEFNVEVVKGEAAVTVGDGTVFATLKTTTNASGKKVAAITSNGVVALNYYEREKVVAEIESCEISTTTCNVGDDIVISGKLKETPNEFNTRIEHGDKFTVKQAVDLDFEDPELKSFSGILTAKEEGTHKVVFTLTEPSEEKPFEWDITVSAAARKKATTVTPLARKAREMEIVDGVNQHVFITIIKPTSSWIQIKNEGNLKETVDKIAILEDKKDGVEQYTVTKSGTAVIEFQYGMGKYSVVVSDPAEINEAVVAPVAHKVVDGKVVLDGTTYVTFNGITFVLYDGLLISPKQENVVSRTVYFDAKSDTVDKPRYVVNYVPANCEPIMSSLKYIAEQVKTFSEVLIVWGTKPATSADPDTLSKHVNKLVNLPKFKRGFKVRTSATKEVDYGMFLSTVVGTIKVNGIGGISNFTSHRVVDYEREDGGNGDIKPLTDKVFVELTTDFTTGSNVEIKTFVGVKQKTIEAVVLSTKEVLGKTMLTLDTEIDTSVFSLGGFEVMISNTDSKDRHGSYAAAAFAILANQERDRSPIQTDIEGTADFTFSQEMLQKLIANKFTVINKNLLTGKGVVVDTPVMTRKDSDYQSRSSIGTVLVLLNALRKVANDKKGKRFPKKEDKVMLEEDLRTVFVNELNRSDSLITNYQFATDMSKLDTKGYLSVRFRIQDAKKLEVVEFAGGLAKL